MKAIIAIIAVAALTGCTSIKTPDGSVYRNTIFTKQFSELEIEKTSGTNVTKVKIKGFKSDAEAIAGAVSEGITKGIAKGAVPVP